MNAVGGDLTELRATARMVFGRVEALGGRWRSGTLDAPELDDLTRAVWLLRVDVELYAPGADPSSPSDLAVLATIREGIDAAIAIVTGLLERSPAPAPLRRGGR